MPIIRERYGFEARHHMNGNSCQGSFAKKATSLKEL